MIVLATSTLTILVLLLALALIMFAAVLFLVNNYYLFIDGAEQAAKQSPGPDRQLDIYPGASEDYQYFTSTPAPAWIEDDGFSDPEAAEELLPNTSAGSARRPQSQYYRQPGTGQDNVPKIFPLLTAAILALSTAIAAAVYWRQR